MANTRLLQAVCTAAIFAAAPALAQTNMPTGETGAGGAPNAPTTHETMPSGTMAPADQMTSPHRSMGGLDHSAHRAAMGHRSGAMHGKTSESEEVAVDRLNAQSFQAARSGQAFDGSGSGAMTAPDGSGSMNDMHGGSMSGSSPNAGGKM
jgi:hypothetical protein